MNIDEKRKEKQLVDDEEVKTLRKAIKWNNDAETTNAYYWMNTHTIATEVVNWNDSRY